MVGFKLVISTKDGKSVQKEVKDLEARGLVGKKIGDVIKGELLGLAGSEFQITGGSDYCGFPMRKDVPGTARKRILAVKGIGIKKKAKGIRQRKTVCGNTIHPRISQVNLKVLKEGAVKIKAEKKGEETEEGEKAEGKEEKAKEEKRERKGEGEKKEEKKGKKVKEESEKIEKKEEKAEGKKTEKKEEKAEEK